MKNDHLFSHQSTTYQKRRPTYPIELFEFLAKVSPAQESVWDVATGTGQAAQGLSHYFKQVNATDVSSEQIAQAIPRENIQYCVGRAEVAPVQIRPGTLDLITIAQGIHWFDLDTFYPIAKSLLKKDGVIAAWGYSFHEEEDPKLRATFDHFYFEILGPYWKPHNRVLWDSYLDLPFPFEEIETPEFHLELEWTFHELLEYFSTWSSSQVFIQTTGKNPIEELSQKLKNSGVTLDQLRLYRWKLALKVGT